MNIKLKDITPSPRAVRKTWDEEGLELLSLSIKEHGLIVPIKVRPNGEGKYEIVYGHRRVKAMRRAGIKETEAIVEGVDERGTLIQALIENVQREEMTPIDIAKTLYAIQEETGWSQKEMAKRGIMPAQSISRMMSLLRETLKVQRLISRGESGGHTGGSRVAQGLITPFHVESVRATGLEMPDRDRVLEKAAKESLTAAQTRQLAETISVAPSEQAKVRYFEWDFSATLHDPERVKARARVYGKHDPLYREREPEAVKNWRNDPEFKALIDNVHRIQNERLPAWRKTTRRLPPEAKQYIAGIVRGLTRAINVWNDELES